MLNQAGKADLSCFYEANLCVNSKKSYFLKDILSTRAKKISKINQLISRL